ncbi:ATP-binding protein [Amycolatopsis kentuckyensis]|uniref:ATP-binding protein n=1 Tax=Amycolatopsis kentuckyensis TaxID=218823 RepID=UPI0035620190
MTRQAARGGESGTAVDGGNRTTGVALFEEVAPARPDEVSGLRHRLATWLGALPVTSDVGYDVTLATYEALTNVVDHAYPGRAGKVRLRAAWNGAGITVEVTDTGRGLPARPRCASTAPTERGRGLILIRKTADEVRIETGENGTTVVLTWRARPGAH